MKFEQEDVNSSEDSKGKVVKKRGKEKELYALAAFAKQYYGRIAGTTLAEEFVPTTRAEFPSTHFSARHHLFVLSRVHKLNKLKDDVSSLNHDEINQILPGEDLESDMFKEIYRITKEIKDFILSSDEFNY